MSDQQQSNVNSQQEQEDDEQNSQQQQQDDDDEQEDDDEQQQGSGDDDEQQDDDQDGLGDDDQQQQGSGEDQQQQSKQEQGNKKLPTFKMVKREQPEQFKFTSLLSEISNLSCSVDNFIGTLHTAPESGVQRRTYGGGYGTQDKFYQTRLEDIKVTEPQGQSRVVIMKDNDAQVDMKPQIIIQPTKSAKQDPVIQAKPYKISTQSEKFLSQLYQENKKLKRWQVNPTHPMNSYMTSFAGSNGFSNSGKGFYNSKDKFERKQYEKGIFNVDERNKQIDEAIMMLKRQEQQQY